MRTRLQPAVIGRGVFFHMMDVCRALLSRRPWLARKKNTRNYWKCLTSQSSISSGAERRSSTCGPASALAPAPSSSSSASSLGKQHKTGMKNVCFSLLCGDSVLRLSDLAALRFVAAAVIGLRPEHPTVFFLVYALVLVFLGILKNVRANTSLSLFLFHRLSSQVLSDDCLHSHLCSCCRENSQSKLVTFHISRSGSVN